MPFSTYDQAMDVCGIQHLVRFDACRYHAAPDFLQRRYIVDFGATLQHRVPVLSIGRYVGF